MFGLLKVILFSAIWVLLVIKALLVRDYTVTYMMSSVSC